MCSLSHETRKQIQKGNGNFTFHRWVEKNPLQNLWVRFSCHYWPRFRLEFFDFSFLVMSILSVNFKGIPQKILFCLEMENYLFKFRFYIEIDMTVFSQWTRICCSAFGIVCRVCFGCIEAIHSNSSISHVTYL